MLACVVLLGCVRLPDAPTLPTEDPAFSAPEIAERPGVDEDPPPAMVILPRDVVVVRAFSADVTEYEGLVVDARGQVHLPLVGDVEVGGLTLLQAEERVQAAMRRLDSVVRVSIGIEDPDGHTATVLGAVSSPGSVPVRPGMRVVDLLASAHLVLNPGEGEFAADVDAARLVRDGEELPISVARAYEGDPRHNIYVRPGDHLFVPPVLGQGIVVLGAVRDPAVLRHYEGIRLTEVLAGVGGLNERGDRTDVHIVRGPVSEPLVYRASLREVVNGNRNDIVMAPGDIVYVTEEWTAHTGEVLGRISALLSQPTSIGLLYVTARALSDSP